MSNEKRLKIVVVGGVAGGASAAARIRRIDGDAEIVMLERGANVSFSNCCLPYHLNGLVPEIENLLLFSPERFHNQYRIDARVFSEVIAINRKDKTVTVKNHQSGKSYEESYDKLILSPGADAILPDSIKGIDGPNVFPLKNVTHLRNLVDFLDKQKREEEDFSVCVCGGGFIGLESAEVLKEAGYDVHLVEAKSQVMSSLDKELAALLHKELYDNDVHLHLEKEVKEIQEDKVLLADGTVLPCRAVIMAVGVRPAVDFAAKSGIEIGETGGIRVSQNYMTNDPDIYAVGDAIEVYNALTMKPTLLSMAGPAQRQARAAADDIYGKSHQNKGVIGSSSLHLFDLNIASTGLSARDCKEARIPYDYAYTIPFDSVSLMPESKPLYFKLIFERPTGRILGAQAVGEGDATKRIDVIAALIGQHADLEDLKELELCYSPHYGTPKDVINHTALVALNILHGVYRQVHVEKVRELVESGATILDVRSQEQWDAGHLKGAIHIPLAQVHDRMDELPKDLPIYVQCRSGQYSYFALQSLKQAGFKDLYNVSGAFLGICANEYYDDKTTNRDPIVTNYNFK